MVRVIPLLSAAFLFIASGEAVLADSQHPFRDSSDFLDTCKLINNSISTASAVYYPPSPSYTADNKHWAVSSSALSACSVEPGNPEDLGVILRILGDTRTPFAVKGGGHATNPGFSSTPGVQIAMRLFDKITVNQTTSTVEIGAGLLWDDVYRALDGTGLNVVGGRVSGVGVAGFILGGGYSWKTSQFGLTIDTMDSYHLVLPDGTVQIVTPANEDLWFGLRGGFNNFGIVTKFVLKAHPQGDVWGGFTITPGLHYADKVNAAIVKFQQEVTDKKAMVLPTYNTVSDKPSVELLFFYDGPEPPAGIFDDFLAIPELQIIVGPTSFLEFFSILPSSDPFAGKRAYFSNVPVLEYTSTLLDAIVNETRFWGDKLAELDSHAAVSYDIEPFDSGLFSHSNTPSAYPPDRSRALLPTNLYFAWTSPTRDADVAVALQQSTNAVRAAAIADGQDVANAALYGNYALFGTPVESLYGANLQRLRDIRSRVDPKGVMGLAGGFKV
ncbi:FAD dependent oxidoreductase [Russula earlei]|uniref:FAD dependent oxidoreductase n=1 Tax=Russula earlei TaxID=71964 RepID=A0ACC0TWG3_9AGAM|nr:FAD dependent oxidoreductase [Russula earlei]